MSDDSMICFKGNDYYYKVRVERREREIEEANLQYEQILLKELSLINSMKRREEKASNTTINITYNNYYNQTQMKPLFIHH